MSFAGDEPAPSGVSACFQRADPVKNQPRRSQRRQTLLRNGSPESPTQVHDPLRFSGEPSFPQGLRPWESNHRDGAKHRPGKTKLALK